MIFANVLDDGKGTRLAYLYDTREAADAAARKSVAGASRREVYEVSPRCCERDFDSDGNCDKHPRGCATASAPR